MNFLEGHSKNFCELLVLTFTRLGSSAWLTCYVNAPSRSVAGKIETILSISQVHQGPWNRLRLSSETVWGPPTCSRTLWNSGMLYAVQMHTRYPYALGTGTGTGRGGGQAELGCNQWIDVLPTHGFSHSSKMNKFTLLPWCILTGKKIWMFRT